MVFTDENVRQATLLRADNPCILKLYLIFLEVQKAEKRSCNSVKGKKKKKKNIKKLLFFLFDHALSEHLIDARWHF